MDARTLLPGPALNRGRRIQRPRPRPRLGLTLIELLLGLAITALVGLGVTMILVSASYGTTTQKELRSLAVRHKTIAARFDAALRASRKVLAAGT
ncbi:MAG: hypothetical protein OER86_11180, partial [Phycisphaerae bacterium]|nr:hypothetical protein [Phycisphaerae bacterium]